MIYCSIDKEFKSIVGAVREGEQLSLTVRGNFENVSLLVRKDGSSTPHVYKMDKNGDCFNIAFTLPVGLYFYLFSLENGDYIGADDDFCGVVTNKPKEFQLTFYSNDFTTPDWIKGGVIYQIFPDRFYRSNQDKVIDNNKILRNDWGEIPSFLPNEDGEILNNDFFGGDLKGIESKLDYIADLGVNVIYLNPIFRAYSNHRYDTGDYMQIDPLLGNENDFVSLINSANERGIKIVLDGVFNHVGSDSLYFNKYGRYSSIGAYQSQKSVYKDWFKFIDYPNLYESWWGIKTLPATDKTNIDFINFITGQDGVIEHYTKLGIGGWRLDVVDELPDDFVKLIRKATKNINIQSIVIGEVWENASNKISYGERREYFQGKELDSVMNYPLKNAIIDFVKNKNTAGLVSVIKEQIDNYPSQVLHSLMNILSTHDTFRLISALSNQDVVGKSKKQLSNLLLAGEELASAIKLVKYASLLQFTLCGVPCIYYGDETAMQGYTDPLNRRCYPWDNQNFDLINWYKLVGKLRKNFSCFKQGELNIKYFDKGIIIFERKDLTSNVLIGVNISDNDIYLNFDGELTDFLTGNCFIDCFELKKDSCCVLYNQL